MSLEQEYRWYRTGCLRLGYPPEETLPADEFALRWREWEAHAEQLEQAEATGTLHKLDVADRALKERLVDTDPFVKALLVGMAEDPINPG